MYTFADVCICMLGRGEGVRGLAGEEGERKSPLPSYSVLGEILKHEHQGQRWKKRKYPKESSEVDLCPTRRG